MSVGSKIKILRKKHGLTQSELADGIITRGMLSRIENGSALPSMQTLFALAERLQIPPGFLFEDSEDILPTERARIIETILDEFRNGNLQGCLDIFTYSGLQIDHATAGIYVSCTFSAALQSFYSGDFPTANAFLQKVTDALPLTPLPPAEVTPQRIAFLHFVMQNVSNLDNVIATADDMPDYGFQLSLFFFVLKLLLHERYDAAQFFTEFGGFNPQYRKFIEAQLMIRDYKFIDAILMMKALVSDSSCPVILTLLCHHSMEKCCKLCEDYKGAYENHIRYQELLATIQKS